MTGGTAARRQRAGAGQAARRGLQRDEKTGARRSSQTRPLRWLAAQRSVDTKWEVFDAVGAELGTRRVLYLEFGVAGRLLIDGGAFPGIL